jgi:hypothetical protein
MPSAKAHKPRSTVAAVKQVRFKPLPKMRHQLAVQVRRKGSPEVYAPASHQEIFKARFTGFAAAV